TLDAGRDVPALVLAVTARPAVCIFSRCHSFAHAYAALGIGIMAGKMDRAVYVYKGFCGKNRKPGFVLALVLV
ncbi:MAG TPA: hypothetical protein VKZ51_00860, partial [Cyclobacteriaceae bacterium]|nr:hypothetical protein [Cyclobacteriaceae bacterium]